MMHSTFHLTADTMKSLLERTFQDRVTQADKDAARQLRELLVATHSVYQSVLFDIMELAHAHDRAGLAEIAFLVGMQAGYELGIAHPPRAEQTGR